MSTWIVGGCYLSHAILCACVSLILGLDQRKWVYLTIMSLLQAIFSVIFPFYFTEEDPKKSLFMVGFSCANLCFVTVILGYLTCILLELKGKWLLCFQKINLCLAIIFSTLAYMDLIFDTRFIYYEVMFVPGSLFQKILIFSPIGYFYLLFVSIAYTLFAILFILEQKKFGKRFQPISLGLIIYYLSVISDFNILYGIYDFFWLQHYCYLAVVLGFTWYFVRDHYETQRKYGEALQSISEHKEELMQVEHLKTLGLVSAYIGHEIKNPLSTIVLSNYLIRKKMNETSENKHLFEKYVDKVDSSAVIIQKIIDGIFNFVNRKVDSDHQPSSIHEICSHAKLFTEEKVKECQIDLRFELPAQDFKIVCNPTQVTQVIINLIINACEAVTEQKNAWIIVSVEKTVNLCKISVLDAGSGFSKDLVSKISNPFYTTKTKAGSGLGLSIVQEIARLHRAYVNFGSKDGNTCITFTLPRRQPLDTSVL